MPTLVARFPAGRYHATPWGHHVNEGLIEWPPSPWRILRALLATGYSKLGWSIVPDAGRRLIEALATTLPSYRLPAASVAHSRHYMPIGEIRNGREVKTLVLDAWLHLGSDPMLVRWNCRVDDEARELFQLLSERLSYLGRSESWVEASTLPDAHDLTSAMDAYPDEGGGARPGWEQVSLLAAEESTIYAAWRERAVEKALAAFPLPEGRKKAPATLERKRKAAVTPYPAGLLDCLQSDTAWWKAQGWAQPPGCRRVLYWRRCDALEVAPPLRRSRPSGSRVQCMLLALSPESGSRSLLPRRVRALPQGELLHRALVAKAGRGSEIRMPELTGRDQSGRPLVGHRHAHALCLDLDGDDHLEHVLLYAPMGLGPAAQEAVRGLRRTWTKGGAGDIRLSVVGAGSLNDLRSLRNQLGSGICRVLGPIGGAQRWRSFTPFVAPRFLKRAGTNSLEGQIGAELASRGLPAAAVEILPWSPTDRDLRHAVRVRRAPAGPPPVDIGFVLRLSFESPVQGPIALGYGSHFGLGLFLAEAEP